MTEDTFYVGIRIASGGVSKPLESAFLNCSFDVQQPELLNHGVMEST